MSNRYLFDLPYFAAMESDEVSIGAPVIDGAIQIGMPRNGQADKRRLKVAVGDEAIRISREDGEGIQFVTWGLNEKRVPVLGQAAGELVLAASGDERFELDGRAVEVNYVRGLDYALWVISDRAIARQAQNHQPS